MRIGIVGVGYLGSLHARVLSEIDDPHVDFTGVYDIDPQRMEDIAKRYNVKAFPSLDALLDETDAVICAVPTTEHYRVGIQILEAQKHLLMEKPITETVEQATRLVETARQKGLKLMVGHIERFNPAILAVRDKITFPLYIEALRIAYFNIRGTDVDVIRDLMIHDIDLTLYFTREEPISISAVGAPVLTDKVDIANARLEFPSGTVATLTASRVSIKKTREFRIFQRDAYFSLNLMSRNGHMIKRGDEAIIPYFLNMDGSTEPLKLEDMEFIQSIVEDRDPHVTGEDGLRALRIAKMIEKEISKKLAKLEGEET
ncbi:MAG: Gfo/Idh/MocA family oxidoreductase [Thermotogae bacterium]|nr:Gfo/Idh/MocA family oxidoreductase [Thermotogota bacterium]